jgi:hypothetical protein
MRKSVRILGKKYKIYVKRMADEKNIFRYGLTTHWQKKIELNSAVDQDQKDETLLHEIVHCLDANMGLGLSERQVSSLSTGLHSVFKDNKFKGLSK